MPPSVGPGKFIKDLEDCLVGVETDPAAHWREGIHPSTEPPSWSELYSLPSDIQLRSSSYWASMTSYRDARRAFTP